MCYVTLYIFFLDLSEHVAWTIHERLYIRLSVRPKVVQQFSSSFFEKCHIKNKTDVNIIL